MRSYYSRIFLLMMIMVSPAYATKTCPPDPCRDSEGKFRESICIDKADWVAVGTITNVRHRPDGHSLNKDFAEFLFRPKSWLKGKKIKRPFIPFKVGWCDNRQELPEDYSGEFKFFGLSRLSSEGQNQYLGFVAIK